MACVNDSNHPLYVSEKNRQIARDRVRQYVESISDYMEVKNAIPTGFNSYDQIKDNKKRILKVLGGSKKDWDNWKWQFKNSIRDVSVLSKIIQINDQEKKDIEKT